MHLAIGGMPAVRFTRFECLQHRLADHPFGCQRLAWVPQADADKPVLTTHALYLWEDTPAQCHEVLTHAQTGPELLACGVDPTQDRVTTPPPVSPMIREHGNPLRCHPLPRPDLKSQ
jgi:hypothetical protein